MCEFDDTVQRVVSKGGSARFKTHGFSVELTPFQLRVTLKNRAQRVADVRPESAGPMLRGALSGALSEAHNVDAWQDPVRSILSNYSPTDVRVLIDAATFGEWCWVGAPNHPRLASAEKLTAMGLLSRTREGETCYAVTAAGKVELQVLTWTLLEFWGSHGG